MTMHKLKHSWQDPGSHFDNCICHPWYSAIFQLSACLFSEAGKYFETLGYRPALSPITTGSISSPMGLGSDSDPVKVDLFGTPTYLADSMQFHLEYLLRLHRIGVYYIMPTFRGEFPDARHLNEFFHVEAEIVGNLDQTMKVVEGLLVAYVRRTLQEHAAIVTSVAGSVEHLETVVCKAVQGFRRVSFSEALDRLNEDERSFKRLNGCFIGLTSAGEQELLRQLGEPLWVTHLPRVGVPFYQADYNEHYSQCADLLMGIGEVVGCGERHTTASEAQDGLELRQVDPLPYAWYLRLKRHYPMRTAGFGLGVERLLLWMLKHDDIRDMQIFIRQRGIHGVP